MKSVIVTVSSDKPNDPAFGVFNLKGVDIGCNLFEDTIPQFSPNSREHNKGVLLRKLAFSCNYRDINLMHSISEAAQREKTDVFCGIGSEFVAEIIEIGAEVKGLKVGDRVIADNAYPNSDNLKLLPGVPTNEASILYQILHYQKLLKIPNSIPTEVAAGMSIGCQTSYGMVRRAAPKKDDNILVTSARSNTSLFIIGALKAQGFENIYALSSSTKNNARLKAMGVKEIIKVDYNNPQLFEDPDIIYSTINSKNGIDIVFDPFIDTYLFTLSKYLNIGAKYLTCGVQIYDSEAVSKNVLIRFLASMVLRNISIIGHCLGSSDDLKRALNDLEKGKLHIPIDSSFSKNHVCAFFEKTYLSKEKFGKVIYKY